jgi:membrane fusion protein (multidrug efflux system)
MERKKIIIGVVVAAIAIIASYFIYQHVIYVETDNAQVEAHALLIAAKVSGYINKVNVVEGQKVKQGDVLVEIDDRDYQNVLHQVQGDLSSLQARLKDAERNYHRIGELFHKEAVSQQQYDQVSAAYNDLKSKVDSASAQLAQAELNLENTKLKAPTVGFIAKKSAEIGQLAAPGVALIGFVGADERWVVANFKETDVSSIEVGAEVKIAVDAVGSTAYNGHVESLSSATGATFTLLPPDNATGNFTKVVQRVPVKVKFDNLSEQDFELLRAGLSCVVKVRKH